MKSDKIPIVSIFILNFNGKSFNKDCINSIFNQTYKNFEIIFIDNNSTDGSLEEVENMFSKEIKLGIIKIVKNNDNLRFAGGNNSGIPYVSKESEYVWLLNNDTVIDQDCLFELINGIESNTELGAVSSIILDKGIEDKIKEKMEDGQVRITNPFGLQIWEKGKIKNNVFYTNFLCGCSFLYRKSLIDKPFFDFYKCYAEDLELSRELILKGHKLGICKNSIVNHFGSGTMNKNPKYWKLYYNERNLLLNYKSFFNKKTRIKLSIPFVTFHFLQLIANIKIFKTLFKAKFDALIWVNKNKQYINIIKSKINNGKQLSEDEFLKTMSYKLASDDLHSGKIKMFFINSFNYLNKLYFKMVHIPFV